MIHPVVALVFIDRLVWAITLLVLPYSLNILRGKFLLILQFWVLSVKIFTLEIFRPPYRVIHFGSVCKSTKFLFLATLLNLEIFAPLRLYGTY